MDARGHGSLGVVVVRATRRQTERLRVLAFILAAVLVGLGVAAPVVVVNRLFVHYNDACPPGVPISDSPFADLASEVGDPVCALVISARPLLLVPDFPDPALTEDQALAIAETFLKPHISTNESLALRSAQLALPSSEWYPFPSRWLLIFSRFTLAVDAVTGTVLDFFDGSAGDSNSSEISAIPESEAQSRASAFLRLHNISIPASAYYAGAYNYLTSGIPMYLIRFIHVEQQAIVDGDQIAITINLATGEVLSYFRRWIGLPAISTTGIVAGSYVARLVRASMENPSAYIIDEPVLELLRDPNLSQNTFVLRLCWVTRLHDVPLTMYAASLNDAFTAQFVWIGITHILRGSIGSAPPVVNELRGFLIGVLGVVAASAAATGAHSLARRRRR